MCRAIIFGEITRPNATRTLAIYVHYDGQPADPTQWTHDPWEATLYTAAMEEGGEPRPFPKPGEEIDPEWRLYARSAGDDKAPIAALLAVLDAFRESDIAITSNIKFFFEGEEEAGSARLPEYLEIYRDRLGDIDVWLFCDGPVHQSRSSQLVFGARGVTGMEVTIYGANRPLHSGHYGNWAPVPGTMLALLLASMKDDTGRVLVEGFYDSVEPVGEEERAAIRNLPDIDRELRASFGLARTEADNTSIAERLLLPALTVRGLSSGNVGPTDPQHHPIDRNGKPGNSAGERERSGENEGPGGKPHSRPGLPPRKGRSRRGHASGVSPDRGRSPGEVATPAARTPMDLPISRQLFEAVQRAARQRCPTGAGPRRIVTPVPVFRPRLHEPTGGHRSCSQPRQQPARPRREPENRKPLVRHRPLRRLADHAVNVGCNGQGQRALDAETQRRRKIMSGEGFGPVLTFPLCASAPLRQKPVPGLLLVSVQVANRPCPPYEFDELGPVAFLVEPDAGLGQFEDRIVGGVALVG